MKYTAIKHTAKLQHVVMAVLLYTLTLENVKRKT